MFSNILVYKKSALFVCFTLMLFGCGTFEYEEKANETLKLVAELDEANRLLGFPLQVPEQKDGNGTVLTKDTYLRLPNENYSIPYKDIEKRNGMLVLKYGKQKGGADIPREVFLAFANETDGGIFLEGVLERFEAKNAKKKEPSFKIKDEVKIESYDFTNSSSESVQLFVAFEEKLAVAFVYDLDKSKSIKQEKNSERSMKTFRINANALDAKAKWNLKQLSEGGSTIP